MNGYVSVQALIDYANNTIGGIDANDIARFPRADVVEVVRCKDCKYYKATQFKTFDGEVHEVKYCHRFGFPFNPNDYCSYGKGGDV